MPVALGGSSSRASPARTSMLILGGVAAIIHHCPTERPIHLKRRDVGRGHRPRLQFRMKITGLLATRRSLVDRLGNWDDHSRWQEVFETYWKLIYSVARKAGLSDAEAQDVVQETVITVAKNVGKLGYDP